MVCITIVLARLKFESRLYDIVHCFPTGKPSCGKLGQDGNTVLVNRGGWLLVDHDFCASLGAGSLLLYTVRRDLLDMAAGPLGCAD